MNFVVDARMNASGDSVRVQVNGPNGTSIGHFDAAALDQVIAALQRLRQNAPVRSHLEAHMDLGQMRVPGAGSV